ncbi:MAG: DUF5683 domain-containing protein [bacterium]
MKRTLIVILFLSVSGRLFSSPPSESEYSALKPSQERFQFKQKFLQRLRERSVEQREFFAGFNGYQSQTPLKKNKGAAFLRSLVLPGWGQHYAESKTMMKAFIASEVLLWGAFIGLESWGNWLEDDYKTFSVQHAKVDLDGKPKGYFVDISNFNDIFEFNQEQLRNRDVNALYTDTEAFFWQWDNEQNRRKYDDLRVRSDRARNRADLALAFIFTNHIVSAIHATLAVFKFNQRLKKQGLGIKLDSDSYSENRYIKIGLEKSF